MWGTLPFSLWWQDDGAITDAADSSMERMAGLP